MEPTLPNETATENTRAVIGDNNPPAYDLDQFAATNQTVDRFINASDQWATFGEIASETLAGQLKDQIDGLRKLRKYVEDERISQKKPHDDMGKKVQAVYIPVLDKIDKAVGKLTPLLSRYLKRQEEAAAAAKREAQLKAQQAEAEAKAKIAEAQESGTVSASIEAEEAAKAASRAAADAIQKPTRASVQSASGAGGRATSIRTRKVCTLRNASHAFLYFKDNPKIHDLLVSLANAEANAAGFPKDGKIPGMDIEIKETVV